MIYPKKYICDIPSLSKQDIYNLIHEVQKNGLAIIYNQNLSENSLIEFMKKIGRCEVPNKFMNPPEFPEISIVTAKKDSHGNKIGMFGQGELGWHSNGNSRHNVEEILVGLYCKKSDPNSTLSVCNTSLPFYDLPREKQEFFKKIRIKLKFKNNSIYNLDEGDPELEFMSMHRGSTRKLVSKHPITGLYYLYFPYHFIIQAWLGNEEIDHNALIEELKPLIFKSQYQYHHVFYPGDLLLMDQLNTLHRRSSVSNDRLLWRVACDYSESSVIKLQNTEGK